MKKLKIGLIGCGKMMARHVRGIKHVDNAEIVSVCDVIRENAVELAAELGNNPTVYTDWRDMVDEIDAARQEART